MLEILDGLTLEFFQTSLGFILLEVYILTVMFLLLEPELRVLITKCRNE